jgi:hypothetical protein
MSFLTEVQGGLDCGDAPGSTNYEYHLPHTKTIDLIGEEFAPKRSVVAGGTGPGSDVISSAPNVVVVSAVPASLGGGGGNLIQTTTAGGLIPGATVGTTAGAATGAGPHLIPVSMAMSSGTTLTTTEVDIDWQIEDYIQF